MAFVVTDSSAKNIYSKMYRYYGGRNMPDNDTGVFFGFANFTRDKIIYCIEFLKRQFGAGWFTTDYATRKAALDKICTALYTAFNQTVSKDALFKFCSWVYTFTANDADALNYFIGQSDYGVLDDLWNSATETISNKVSNAVETISYGVSYPSLEKITPKTGTLVKWGLIIGGGLLAVNYITKKVF